MEISPPTDMKQTGGVKLGADGKFEMDGVPEEMRAMLAEIEKEKAAKALDRMLQMHEQQRAANASAVVKAGAIIPCVALLKEGTNLGQMHAAGSERLS